jgi:hypothetical protein
MMHRCKLFDLYRVALSRFAAARARAILSKAKFKAEMSCDAESKR